jgi:ABC-type multidrug transport system fused ATPase/permease subunit
MLFTFVAERFTFILIDWWLSSWSAMDGQQGALVETVDFFGIALPPTVGDGVSTYLVVYVCLCLVNAVLVLARLLGISYLGSMASKRLYSDLSMGVLDSPMVFFETTPLGRVLNRFSYDTDAIDYILVQKMNGAVASLFWLISALVVVISVVPFMALVFVPVLILYFFLQRYYRRSCVDLQRLDSNSRSPVQSHFSETLQGLASIRAYRAEDRFSRTCDAGNDANHGALACYTLSNRWLMVRLECLGAIVTLATSIFCWTGAISPSLAGLAILWAFNFTTSLNFNVIMSTVSRLSFLRASPLTYSLVSHSTLSAPSPF